MTFSTGQRHVGLHAVNDGGTQVETARRIGDSEVATIGDDFRAFLLAAGDEAEDAVAVGRGDDRTHVGLGGGRGLVGAADFYRAGGGDEVGEQAFCCGADGESGGTRHAAFAGAAERGGGERLDRFADVGIGHDYEGVLRAAVGLDPFAVAGTGLVNVFRDGRGADEGNCAHFGMSE